MTAAVSAAETFASNLLPVSTVLLESVNFIFFFVVITLLFALILKSIPHTPIHWRDVRFAAAVTSLLFTIGQGRYGMVFRPYRIDIAVRRRRHLS